MLFRSLQAAAHHMCLLLLVVPGVLMTRNYFHGILLARRQTSAMATGSAARVVAIGTTTVRVLETIADSAAPDAGRTSLLIQPGYAFRSVGMLVTNFHLPRSTLLALVMAFGGESLIRDAYARAVARGYRFYSFGDAMAIL